MCNTNVPTKGKTVVAAGGFAAVHKGHQKLILEAVALAKEKKIKSCIFTFDDTLEKHKSGQVFLKMEKRLELMQQMGVDIVYSRTFDEEFKSLSPEDFVTEILKKELNADTVIVGENFRFGKNASGTAEMLAKICTQYNIMVKIIKLKKTEEGKVISTSLIKELLLAGDAEKVIELCGRPFEIEGKIVHGRGDGHMLGMPTANINLQPMSLIPAFGVYITALMVEGKKYPAITNIGPAPTFNISEPVAESHVLNYNGNLYGKEVKVYFLKKVRDVQKFNSRDKLIKQMESDKLKAEDYIKHNKEKLSMF